MRSSRVADYARGHAEKPPVDVGSQLSIGFAFSSRDGGSCAPTRQRKAICTKREAAGDGLRRPGCPGGGRGRYREIGSAAGGVADNREPRTGRVAHYRGRDTKILSIDAGRYIVQSVNSAARRDGR